MSDPVDVRHALPRHRDRRLLIAGDDVPAYTTRSRCGVRLHLPAIIRYGQTLTIEQYRRWEKEAAPTTDERNQRWDSTTSR